MITGEETQDSDSRPGDAGQENARSPFIIVIWIMAGVLIWGTFHAIGVYVSAREPNILKPMIVYGCVLGFLGFWAIMLWHRGRDAS